MILYEHKPRPLRPTKESKSIERKSSDFTVIRWTQLGFLIIMLLSSSNYINRIECSETETINVNATSLDKESLTQASTVFEVIAGQAIETTSGKIQAEEMTTTTTTTTTREDFDTKIDPSLVKSEAPRLSPAIEEVASELSKKYLNLANDFKRKQHQQQQQQNEQVEVEKIDLTTMMSTERKELSNEVFKVELVERDIEMSNLTKKIDSVPVEEFNGKRKKEEEEEQTTTTTATATTTLTTTTTTESDISNKTRQQDNNWNGKGRLMSNKYHGSSRNSRRRQKSMDRERDDNEIEEEIELSQCHRYLRTRSFQSSFLNSQGPTLSGIEWTRFISHQQFSCSCELRKNSFNDNNYSFMDENDSSSSKTTSKQVWLNCDFIELSVGSSSEENEEEGEREREDNINKDNNKTSDNSFDNIQISEYRSPIRFSQRESGIQWLNEQKFLKLKLTALKSIDLSNNKIREIKSDSFHGLELKLEQLNLENNLLGDFRALFDDGHYEADKEKRSYELINELVFFTDELNKLRKLKWLSLRNNYINQLAPNIFAKRSILAIATDETDESSISELVYLDLSYNLLKLIPSDSIRHLKRLEILKLNKNRIIQVDKESKFPRSLRYLDLSQNMIKSIRHSDLIDLPHLIELNLSGNQLSRLDKTAFVSSNNFASLTNGLLVSVGSSPVDRRNINSNDNEEDRRALVGSQSSYLSDDNKRPNYLQSLVGVDETQANRGQRRRRSTQNGFIVFDSEHDLEADESIISMVSSGIGLKSSIGESVPIVTQFNSTISLNLSYNLFESIPGDLLLSFSNLQTLDLSYNRIRHLDASYLCSTYNLVENLRHLDLSGNLMDIRANNGTNVPIEMSLSKLFACLQRLETMHLSTNRLVKSDTKENIGLSSSSNLVGSFEEIDEMQLDESQQISVGSQLEEEQMIIRVGENESGKNLRLLDLSDNRLKKVPIIKFNQQQPQNLTRLSDKMYFEALLLNFNQIERLNEYEFEQITNLNQLQLDFNRLTQLPVQVMRKFTNLALLSLEGNSITRLEPILDLFAQSVSSLKRFNLAHNRLSQWPELGRTTSNHVNNIELGLEELNVKGNLLSSNNVSTLFDQLAHMKSLRSIDLSYNLLNRVKSEWFKFANENLQILSLSGNHINNIDLGSFVSNQANELRQLKLDFNLLKELKRKTFDSLPNIKEIDLGNNLIHTINSETFYQLNSLKILKLNNNKLTSWKCEYFSHLCNSISGSINADLATLIGNNIIQIKRTNQQATQTTTTSTSIISSVSSLTELDLSYNSLSQLRTNSIAVHTKLIRLNLEHNRLSFIPHDLFKATVSVASSGRQIQLISSLKYLNLAYNRIQMIDNINFKPLRNLVQFDLSFNELQSLGSDIVKDVHSSRKHISSQRISNTKQDDSSMNDEFGNTNMTADSNQHTQLPSSGTQWPSFEKLRYLNLANNQLSSINQSLIGELSPFARLNLNLSYNLLDSDNIPSAFMAKISPQQETLERRRTESGAKEKRATNQLDLIFTIKLESLDLSHNKLNEFPINLVKSHSNNLDSCDLSHNRIQNLQADPMIHLRKLNLEYNPLNRESSELILHEQRNVRYLNLAATRLYAIQQVSSISEQLTSSSSINDSISLMNQRNRLVDNNTSKLDRIRSIGKQINAPYLKSLNLSSNQLVWLASNVFDRLHSLKTLDLSNNQLTRLNLLSSPLNKIGSTLEHLDLHSNLFTNIDSNDFANLPKLRYLDVSNLLSLNNLNCAFLSKLATLTSLKMFNYPQLRQNLINTQIVLNSNDPEMSIRFKQKLRNNLLYSTLGRHCLKAQQQVDSSSNLNNIIVDNQRSIRWLNLAEIEVELFDNFESNGENSFKLEDELTAYLGPYTSKIFVYGLNITSISDLSLLGVTSDLLNLKLSYTSISELPIRQILESVSRKTKLKLDFRNNLIDSIDSQSVPLLEDSIQRSILSTKSSNDDTSNGILKLGSNPIRCDCQARPLWLWLNQHWAFKNQTQIMTSGSKLIDFNELPSNGQVNVNQWIKLNSLSQMSDLKCYFPFKLRGKLTQHVNYNDLVCKTQTSETTNDNLNGDIRQSRKKNESYSSHTNDIYSESDELESEIEFQSNFDARYGVRLTKFNRYPANPMRNDNFLYIGSTGFNMNNNKNESPLDLEGVGSDARSNIKVSSTIRMGKRDQNSVVEQQESSIDAFISSTSNQDSDNLKFEGMRQYNNRHKPNINQRHLYFETVDSIHKIPFTAKHSSLATKSAVKYNWLTESDVLILTVAGTAMTVMSFLIMGICLLKHRLDQSGQKNILRDSSKSKSNNNNNNNNNNKLVMPHAMALYDPEAIKVLRSKVSGSKVNTKVSSSSSSSSSASSSTHNEPASNSNSSSSSSKKSNQNRYTRATRRSNNEPRSKRQVSVPLNGTQRILVPVGQNSAILAHATQNFLMRSPTIRRMHGLASNASDWFNYTLKAYPARTVDGAQRRLFIGGQQQLTPSKSQAVSSIGQVRVKAQNYRGQEAHKSKILPPSLAAGCPLHAFTALQALKEASRDPTIRLDETDCSYCNHLLNAARQTRVQIEIKKKETGNKDKVGSLEISEDDKRLKDMKASQTKDKSMVKNIIDQQEFESDNSSTKAKILTNSFYHSRTMQQNHNKQILRTFSSNNQARSIKNNDEQSTSQLPTIGIDGKFSYNSGSHLNSPPCLSESVISNQTEETRDEGASLVTSSCQEDIFILMPDSPGPSNEANRGKRHSIQCPSMIEIVPIVDKFTENTNDRAIINDKRNELYARNEDECSTSSSPVAYGFMRSSQSEMGTISSALMMNPKSAQIYRAVDIFSSNEKEEEEEEGKTTTTRRTNKENVEQEQPIISRL